MEQIGDILLIKKDEIVLADVLILDMNEDFCHIQSDFENKLDFIVKKKLAKTSCKKTLNNFQFFLNKIIVQKNSELKKHLSNYKNLLTGKIIIENISLENFNNIKGAIKLKKDPKIENFTIENIILKDSVIKNNEWVLGIVLFLAGESLFTRNLRKTQREKNDYFSKLINRFLFVCIFQIFLFILVFSSRNPFIKFFLDRHYLSKFI